MVLLLTPNLQALVHTDEILTPTLRTAHLPISPEPKDVASRLAFSELTKGSGFFSITATAYSPSDAKGTLDQVFAQISAASRPTGTALSTAKQQLDSLTHALAELQKFLATLRENASRIKGGNDGELYTRSFVTLLTEIVAKEQKIRELQSYLEGIKIEDAILPPMLDSRPNYSDLYRRLALVALISLLIPISFVFSRDLWRRRGDSRNELSQSPSAAEHIKGSG
jgi:hypothetical protein